MGTVLADRKSMSGTKTKPLRVVVLRTLAASLPWLANSAHAQSTSPSTPIDGAGMVQILNAIDDSIKSLATGSGATGPVLLGYGLYLLGFFSVVNFVWFIIKGMATGKMLDAFLADILPFGVGAAAAYIFMTGYGGAGNLGDAVLGATDAIQSAVLPATLGGDSGYKLGDLVQAPLAATLRAIVAMTDINTAGSWGQSMSIMDVAGSVMVAFTGFLMKWTAILAAAIVLLIAMGSFIATLVMTQVSVVIALIFLPIFVPFMIFKPLSGMFNTWLNFFVTSCFTKIIGLVMLAVTNKAMDSIAATSKILQDGNSASSAMAFNITQYSMIVLLAGIVALLMGKVPSIASGMIGGAGVGFSGWKELNRGLMAQGPMGGMKAGSTTVGQGGSKAPPHSFAAAANSAPNAMKGVINAAGKAASRVMGERAAKTDMGTADKAGSTTLGSNMAGWSDAKKNAYVKTVEGKNLSRSAGGTPNYVVGSQKSTTDPLHPDNKPPKPPGGPPPPPPGGGRAPPP
jgi:hypothetical protein